MSIDLTPCGHLRDVTCPRCASQKQVDNKQASELLVAFLKPQLTKWWESGTMTMQQSAGSLIGIALGLSIELGASREQIHAAIDKIFEGADA